MIPRAAREAWAFRARVEREATERFARLAREIEAFDPQSPVPALMRAASEDEKRHAVLCAELAGEQRSPALSEEVNAVHRIAPASLGPRQAALYETVAACCITETESVATVTTLLAEDADPQVRATLHEIARDEVGHSRMGWAHLAREAAAIDVSFLSRWIPSMLAGSIGPDAPADEDLLRYGVLAPPRKRELFTQTLLDVVFPGLDQFGIDTAQARQWLAEKFGTQY